MKRIIATICILALMLSVGAFSACALSPTQYADDNPWFDYELGKDPDYSFAVIGDIQTLAWFDQRESTTYTKKLVDWILDNKDDKKIEYVFGLGDTIETLSSWIESGYNTSVTNPGEWSITSTQIKRMNGVLPYMIVRGNHDDEAGYHKYICTDDYKNQMDGFFYDPAKPALRGNSMSNSYKKITVDGQKYLMMALDFDVNDDVIDWANNVIEANPDHRVIVAVHAYNSASGGFLKGDIGQPGIDDETDGDENHDWFYFDGERLWNEIFSKHENMFMVLSGHVSVTDPVVKSRKGAGDNYVFEVLVDPQAHDEQLHESGEAAGAFVMLINFSINGNRLEFEYISTTRDKHYKNSNQYVKKVHGTSLLELKTTTTTTTKDKDDDDSKTSGGCSASLSYSAMAVATLGTSLSMLALRKKKKR
ncbi:MAG: metallophosphoesterase [Clostridia bacterium]|nr:metallophosphoesterase [Clostridia bacterium]